MPTATVNGVPAEHGCYIDGHWGQYACQRIADVAESFGLAIDLNKDPRMDTPWTEILPDGDHFFRVDAMVDATDDLLDTLNAVTEPGSVWHWQDGELFLSSEQDLIDEW